MTDYSTALKAGMEAILPSSRQLHSKDMATNSLRCPQDRIAVETGSLLPKARVTDHRHLEGHNSEGDQASIFARSTYRTLTDRFRAPHCEF